jgi:hypothetical protein
MPMFIGNVTRAAVGVAQGTFDANFNANESLAVLCILRGGIGGQWGRGRRGQANGGRRGQANGGRGRQAGRRGQGQTGGGRGKEKAPGGMPGAVIGGR